MKTREGRGERERLRERGGRAEGEGEGERRGIKGAGIGVMNIQYACSNYIISL